MAHMEPLKGPRKGGAALTSSHSQLLAFAIVYGLGFGGSFSVLSSKPAKRLGRWNSLDRDRGLSQNIAYICIYIYIYVQREGMCVYVCTSMYKSL